MPVISAPLNSECAAPTPSPSIAATDELPSHDEVTAAPYHARAGRRRARVEIEPVAVQIDIVFGHPAHPGETVRIDRVNQQDRGVFGQTAAFAAAQPVDLRARTAKAFDAVRARDQHEHALGRTRP